MTARIKRKTRIRRQRKAIKRRAVLKRYRRELRRASMPIAGYGVTGEGGGYA